MKDEYSFNGYDRMMTALKREGEPDYVPLSGELVEKS
jgi:hypothetical protein